MTKINRITIHGFKSFAHKTEISLGEKYNCILGPNGSGKSNVGDSLCFVLGRLSAKSMRAEKAANLIFNGGKKHKPSSAGVVEIEFDNTDGTFPSDKKSVILSRTITKKGSSIYRINGKRHTRTQTLDLLSRGRINPDGYNIILQGDIMRFVDMPTVERRKIIEQISDISHYENRKRKALLELNKVEEKLGNAEIILKERKSYLRELKRDRDQALKFKDVKDKIDSHKRTYFHIQIEDRRAEFKKFDGRVKEIEGKIKTYDEKVIVLKKEIEKAREKIQAINKEIEEKGEKGQVQVHKEIEEIKTEVIKHKTRVSTLKDEIHKIDVRKTQVRAEGKELVEKQKEYNQKIKDIDLDINRKKAELKTFENKILILRKKNNIGASEDMEKNLAELDKKIDEKQDEIQKVRLKQQELFRENDKIEYQLQTIDEQILKVKAVSQENKEQINILKHKKHEFKRATLDLNKCLDNDSSFVSQLSNARRKLIDLQEQFAKLNARTQSVQANHQVNQAISHLQKKNFSGVYGTIGQLGKVQRKYSVALEAAAGARTNFVVVKDDAVAAKCIRFLKDNRLGSASFIPLNKIKVSEISSEHRTLLKKGGVHDFALNLISYNAQYRKAFAYVFGSALIIDDLSVAREIGIGRARMISLDGSIAEASGVMRGGFRKARGGAFQEKDSLELLDKIQAEIGENQSIISSIENKRHGNDEIITTLRKLKGELEGDIIKLEKSLHLGTDDLDANSKVKKELKEKKISIDKEITEIQKQVNLINRELADLKSRKQISRSKITESKNPRVLAELSAFEEGKQRCRETIIRGENDVKNIKSQVAQLIAPDIEKFEEILKQHDKEKEKFSQELKNLTEGLKSKEKDLKVKEDASKKFYSQYRELFGRREKFNSQVNTAEVKIDKFRDSSRVQERELNLLSLKNAEIKARLSVIEEEHEKYKGADLLKNKTEEELKKELTKFEVILSQMDAVNMKALEKYDEVEKEFNALVEKKQSLHSEKTEVLTLMNEIETRKKDHFMKTFKETNKHFQEIFSKLFTKGSAYLQVDNEKNPFEEGLSIKVKLTGKRYMDLKSLSGGEKTLTALAFIFAVQEHQPAKFYILDEIDAALDKHNSEKLAKLIGSYSQRAQYLVISHNDSIISEADTLYGVSMNDGISKITSLKL